MPLGVQTERNYKSYLRKLKRTYPFLTEEDKEKCMKQMLRIADKLGIELDSPSLLRGPGRPSDSFVVPAYATEAEKKAVEEERVKQTQRVDTTERARKIATDAGQRVFTDEEMKQENERVQKRKKDNELAEQVEKINMARRMREEADRIERQAQYELEAQMKPKEIEKLVEVNRSMDELIEKANDELVEEKEEKPPEKPPQAG